MWVLSFSPVVTGNNSEGNDYILFGLGKLLESVLQILPSSINTFIAFFCCFHVVFPQSLQSGSAHERELEARVARLMGSRRTKASDPSLVAPSAPGEGEDKTYLLFTTGSLTYSPHQIGVWGGGFFFLFVCFCLFIFGCIFRRECVCLCICMHVCRIISHGYFF